MYRAHDDQIDAVFLLHQQLRTLMNRRMAKSKLTYAKYQLLACIKDHQPCTLGQVASALGFLPGSLTKAVEVLVSEQWVQETQDEFDLRKWWLTLSEDGSTVWHQAHDVRDDVSIEILDAIDPSHAKALSEALLAMTKVASLLLTPKPATPLLKRR